MTLLIIEINGHKFDISRQIFPAYEKVISSILWISRYSTISNSWIEGFNLEYIETLKSPHPLGWPEINENLKSYQEAIKRFRELEIFT